MKFLLILLLLVGSSARAAEYAKCRLTGYFWSEFPLVDNMRFETVVDIFTLNNAQTLSLDLNGRHLRFKRSRILVTNITSLLFVLRNNDITEKTARVQLDRTPRQILLTREFKGHIEILNADNESDLNHGFYCYF
jgi:hypothetical protein